MTQKIGIIGGSGLYEIDGLTVDPAFKYHEQSQTVYGKPSAPIVKYTMKDIDAELYFLARHGTNHHLNPSEVPYRANIFALKELGVDWIISVSSVGSLKQEIPPRDMVIIDQFIDRTKNRPCTYFHDGIVAHVNFGDPICATLRGWLLEAAKEARKAIAEQNQATQDASKRELFNVHDGGIYVCMEGPAFSTRAESMLYKSWGASVIGMTNLTEAKLAREAEISYATLAMSTDYDCWHPNHDNVEVSTIVGNMTANKRTAKDILLRVIPKIASFDGTLPFEGSLKSAILRQDDIPPSRLYDLQPILGKYNLGKK